MTTQRISKLVKLKEWISLEEARALLSDLIDEDISHEVFQSEVMGHLPLYIEPADPDSGYFGAIREKDLDSHPKLIRNLDSRSAHIQIEQDTDLETLFELIATRLPCMTKFDTGALISPRTTTTKRQTHVWFVVSINEGFATSFDPRDKSLVTRYTETKALFKLKERISGKAPWTGAPWTTPVTTQATSVSRKDNSTLLVSSLPITQSGSYQPPRTSDNSMSKENIEQLLISFLSELLSEGPTLPRAIKRISEDPMLRESITLPAIHALLQLVTMDPNVNQKSLISKIQKRFGNQRGTSSSNLEKLFGAVNRLGAEKP